MVKLQSSLCFQKILLYSNQCPELKVRSTRNYKKKEVCNQAFLKKWITPILAKIRLFTIKEFKMAYKHKMNLISRMTIILKTLMMVMMKRSISNLNHLTKLKIQKLNKVNKAQAIQLLMKKMK